MWIKVGICFCHLYILQARIKWHIIPLKFYKSSKSGTFKMTSCPHVGTNLLDIFTKMHTGHVAFVEFADQNDILSFGL